MNGIKKNLSKSTLWHKRIGLSQTFKETQIFIGEKKKEF